MKKRIVVIALLTTLLVTTLAGAFALGVSADEEPLVHKVKWGETLSWISWMYKTTIQEIVDENNLESRHVIYAGQELVIPVEENEYVEYEVQAGDSLLTIAAKYDVSIWDIARRNGMWNINLIIVGDKLIIPGGSQEEPEATDADDATAPEATEEIVISSPTDGAAIKSPLTVTGQGKGFENNLAVDILDEDGQVIGQGFVTVNAEFGQYGPFSGEITFTPPAAAQVGRVAVYRISPRDGAIEELASVSVKLEP